jgi:hypothetical protein
VHGFADRLKFARSDIGRKALIRQQPVTGISLKLLAAVLRTNREALMHRADELGVSLVISNEPDHDQAIANGFIDPLLERLKRVNGGEII